MQGPRRGGRRMTESSLYCIPHLNKTKHNLTLPEIESRQALYDLYIAGRNFPMMPCHHSGVLGDDSLHMGQRLSTASCSFCFAWGQECKTPGQRCLHTFADYPRVPLFLLGTAWHWAHLLTLSPDSLCTQPSSDLNLNRQGNQG